MQRMRDELRRAVHPALALFTAFLLGAIVIVLTDFEHLRQIGTDPLAAIGGALADVVLGYAATLSGAIGDPGHIVAAIQSGNAHDTEAALRPISETLVSATPFVFAGLGLAVAFHAGLFNMVVVTGIPLALLTVIVAFAILFVAAPELTRSIWRFRAPTRSGESGANAPIGPAAST